mmetsp:Transcript_17196/g.50269  ORF Transcript_17196/g.50269 Transcript_17196/m.50269 type:complete len:276 (-) Transcript_17196:404-1231(-)
MVALGVVRIAVIRHRDWWGATSVPTLTAPSLLGLRPIVRPVSVSLHALEGQRRSWWRRGCHRNWCRDRGWHRHRHPHLRRRPAACLPVLAAPQPLRPGPGGPPVRDAKAAVKGSGNRHHCRASQVMRLAAPCLLCVDPRFPPGLEANPAVVGVWRRPRWLRPCRKAGYVLVAAAPGSLCSRPPSHLGWAADVAVVCQCCRWRWRWRWRRCGSRTSAAILVAAELLLCDGPCLHPVEVRPLAVEGVGSDLGHRSHSRCNRAGQHLVDSARLGLLHC